MRVIAFVLALSGCMAALVFCSPTAKAYPQTRPDISNTTRCDANAYVIDKDAQGLNVRSGAGQITPVERNASFQISKPRNAGILPGFTFDDDVTKWSEELPETGDYLIEVAPTRGNATYRLTVEIR